MPVICPKCHHARAPGEVAPEWQCPACGVAYAKAAEALRHAEQPAEGNRAAVETDRPAIPWGKLILFFAFAGAVWIGLQASRSKSGKIDDVDVMLGKGAMVTSMRALAETVGPGDVVMYSTTECVYCTHAKNWLNHHGFAFTECNMSNEYRCETEFRQLGGNGTPFLVIHRGDKTYRMRRGFNSEEFLALLER